MSNRLLKPGNRIATALQARWARFWMRLAGRSATGRAATWLASLGAPPFYRRTALASLHPQGYIAPSATIAHADLRLGRHVYIGDRVLIYQDHEGGAVEIGAGSHLYGDTAIQTGAGGCLSIGAQTYIQPRCQFSAYKAPIHIGNSVQIAPNCAFYPYDHGVAPGVPIARQPLQSRGPIIVEDEAWLGFGVIVLAGVRIGKGAVVGAGAVVTRDIPANAIASGVPARVVKMRGDPA